MVLINLTSVFYLLVLIFGVVGAMRGWAKEILALFSVVLAMFVIDVLETLVPFIRDALSASDTTIHFWVRTGILIGLVFFGYQSPSLAQFEGKTRSDRFQDRLLGLILGLANGYLIAGTLWYFLDNAGYPFTDVFFMPSAAECVPGCIPRLADAQEWGALINNLPPAKLAGPVLYIAVAIAFLFVVIVFI